MSIIKVKNKSISFSLLLILCFFIATITSCESSVYDKTVEIKQGKWSSEQIVAFEFDIQDTLPQYNIFLEVEHLTSFNYQNVYCLVESYSPRGLAQKQTNPLELASKKGDWLGNCNDKQCTRKIPFITRSKFDIPGQYKINLYQHSRKDPIEGILSLRLIIEQIQS